MPLLSHDELIERLGGGRRVYPIRTPPPPHRRCVLCGGAFDDAQTLGFYVKFEDGTLWSLYAHAACLKAKRGNRDVRRTIARYHILTLVRRQNGRPQGRSHASPERIG